MPAFARLKTELPLTPNFPLQQKRKRLSPPPPRSIKQENDSEPARPERYNGNRYNSAWLSHPLRLMVNAESSITNFI